MSAAQADVQGARIVVASRCAKTLFTFRRSLVQALASRGADVLTIGAAGEGFEARLREAGIAFRHIPVGSRGMSPTRDLRLFVTLSRLLSRFRPTIVHCFTVKPAIFGTLAAALTGVPVRVVTITGLGHAFTTADVVTRWIATRLYGLALRRAHLVFFQNIEDQRLFVSLGLVDERITRVVSGSGVDLERFAPTPLPSTTGNSPRVLMIGRVLREKGVREYVSAAAMVKRVTPDVQFRLVGGADPRNPSSLSVDEIERLRRSGEVEWVGEVDDVAPFIDAADIVVLPSYREGLPRSLLEAASMGRALIATDAVGCRQVVQHNVNGYLVPVANAAALADAISRLVANPREIVRFGTNARALAEARFDERGVIGETVEAYQALLAERVANAPTAVPS